MENNQTFSPDSLHKRQGKDRNYLTLVIVEAVEKGTGKNISTLRAELSEDQFFLTCLKYVTTTKKALCSVVGIPVEGACRYKRIAEKHGLLVESADQYICPYTKHPAKLISTNPSEFESLQKSKKDNQLTLF